VTRPIELGIYTHYVHEKFLSITCPKNVCSGNVCPGNWLTGKGLVRETSVQESGCPGNVCKAVNAPHILHKLQSATKTTSAKYRSFCLLTTVLWQPTHCSKLRSYPTALYHNHRHHFTALFPGPPGWAGARKELLDFIVQGKINRDRHTDHPAGRQSIRTNQFSSGTSSPGWSRKMGRKMVVVWLLLQIPSRTR